MTTPPTVPAVDVSDLPEKAVRLAGEILQASRDRETSAERKRSAMMARMMNDAAGKKFTIAMADQVLRMRTAKRAARRMDSLITEYGIPKYFAATAAEVSPAGPVISM